MTSGARGQDAAHGLIPLAWDSEHFGFRVARLAGALLAEAEIASALDEARRDGIRLVYWTTDRGRQVSESLLRAGRGILAAQKATYQVEELRALSARKDLEGSPFRISTVPRGEASPELRALAVAAGDFSRFRVDPSFPDEQFKSLFETWVDRSARGEMADAVLAATPLAGPGQTAGMVTVSAAEGLGQIRLIAVGEEFRRRGVGSLLMRAAHAWMVERGVSRSTVLTQLANGPACLLYERAGYHLAGVVDEYHFWPTGC